MQSSLQKSQINILDTDDAAFDRAKAQGLCLYPDLDLFEMDFFKFVVNGHLVVMEEADPSPTNDLIQEDRVINSNPEVVGGDKNEE